MAHDGREGGEGVHGNLRLGASDAPQQGGLAGVRVPHKTDVGDRPQLEPVVTALSAVPRELLRTERRATHTARETRTTRTRS